MREGRCYFFSHIISRFACFLEDNKQRHQFSLRLSLFYHSFFLVSGFVYAFLSSFFVLFLFCFFFFFFKLFLRFLSSHYSFCFYYVVILSFSLLLSIPPPPSHLSSFYSFFSQFFFLLFFVDLSLPPLFLSIVILFLIVYPEGWM